MSFINVNLSTLIKRWQIDRAGSSNYIGWAMSQSGKMVIYSVIFFSSSIPNSRIIKSCDL